MRWQTTPPHGAAKAELQKAGLWDEDAGKPTGAFIVNVTREVREYATLTVMARSEDEAETKTRELHEAGKIDWDTNGADDFEIVFVTPKKRSWT